MNLLNSSVVRRITEWNKKRNGLELSLSLESKMLSEEAKEFFLAESIPHKLQEAADFLFVAVGTRAKYNCLSHKTLFNLTSSFDDWKKISGWIGYMQAEILESLSGVLGDKTLPLLSSALEIVITCNEAKGVEKDANGKVVKGEDYVSPLERIESMCKKQKVV